MVLSWNAEPSRGLNGCTPLPERHIEVHKFTDTQRFTRDGTNHPDRLPNYLNLSDPQGLERHTRHIDGVDTCTHTRVQDRLTSARAVLEMAEDMEKQLWSPPAMKSQRVKSATNKSLLSQDVRFEVLRDTTSELLGPGHYWIEGAKPGLGTVRPESPTRGAAPALDPSRQSRAFISPPRAELYNQGDVPDRTYLSPDFQPANDTTVAWSATLNEPARSNVVDWRWQARIHDAPRQVPKDVQYEASHINQASQRVRIADVAARSESPMYMFRTKEPRLAKLPKERLADTRLSRPRSDEDPGALGPGTFTPYISLGAAKRRTYRLFAPPSAQAEIAYQNNRTLVQSKRATSSPSSSFANTPRGRQSGPYSWASRPAGSRIAQREYD